MANDVSHFKLTGDNTEYSFNDEDAEFRIAQLAAALSAEVTRAQTAESANADAITVEAARAAAAEEENADALADLIANIRVGRITGISVPKNASVQCSVVYTDPLDKSIPPIVSIYSQTTAVLGSCRVTVSDYSTTGFTVNIYNDDPMSVRTPSIIWAVLPAPLLQTTVASLTTLETTRSSLPVANGGTGATSAADARTNLGTPAVTDVFFSSGDTFTSGAMSPFAGLITNSTTDIRFSVPLPKSLAKISNITVTSLVGSVRGVSGYVDGTSDSTDLLNLYDVTVTRESTNLLSVLMTRSATLSNATNNTPVTVFANIGLSFS